MDDRIIVFFDGNCLLCNASVQWILNHEKYHTLSFAPLQGSTFSSLHDLNVPLPDSLIVWNKGTMLVKSEAICTILHAMGGPWNLAGTCLSIIPKFISNAVYDIIAKNRHDWFGRTNECMLMKGAMKHRFLD